MDKSIWYGVCKYLFFFALFYILQSANIQGIYPFAFGMLFALVWCNQKIYILAPMYILSAFLVFFNLESLIISGITSIVFGFAYFMHYTFKKPLRFVLIGMYAFLSQFGMLYFACIKPLQLWNGVVTLIIGIIAMYAYLLILQNVVLRGLRRKFTIDEIISAGVLFFAIGVGLFSLPFGEYIFWSVLSLTLLIVCYIFGATSTLVIACVLGLGASFAGSNFLLTAYTCVLALVVCATNCSKRVLSAIAIVLADIIVGIYFVPPYEIYHLLATLLGAVVFAIIPNKTMQNFTSFVIADKEDIAVRTIVNRSRKALYSRLTELGNVFFEMKNVFNSLVSGVKNFDEVVEYLAKQVKINICKSCNNCEECLHIQAQDTHQDIIEMLHFAYERGKVSLLDVPPNLCANCKKLNVLINTINNCINEYKSNLQSTSNLDSGKLLLGEQMYGVSQVMQALANEVALNISFDTNLEKYIVEELIYSGVVCSEAICYKKNNKITHLTIVVRSKNLDKNKITKVLNKIFKAPMEIVSITNGEKAGFSVLSVENANRYDILFGSAGAIKADSTKSGDTHSVIKLSNNKILVALCDGMGSGKNAQKTSSLALGLIENFYRAGFESDLILSSINKMLTMSEQETFSAIDAGVIDLNNGTCDLIKLGSPITFIKSKNGVKRLEANALPLGILEEMKPNIRACTLNDDDIIIFVTDGIADSFANLDDLDNFILETQDLNPQILANNILAYALERNKNIPQDDMTVLACRIFAKY